MQTRITHTLDRWVEHEAAAEAMVPIAGALYRKHGVVTTIYGRRLTNRSPRELLKLHRFARHVAGTPLPPQEILALLEALRPLQLGPCLIDLAELHHRFKRGTHSGLTPFLSEQLNDIIDSPQPETLPRDIVLFGFGRIGRLVARILIDRAGSMSAHRLRAIVVRPGDGDDLDLVKRASLLRRDSVHGPFDGTITVDPEHQTITANGTVIQVIRASDPGEVDYESYGISNVILVDNTGRWRDRAGLEQHLNRPGIGRVLLTAPGKGDIPNIVHGVNEHRIANEPIIAAASCTTNAVTPVLAAIDQHFGIVEGHIETVHSFTNDQNLTDNSHRAHRRGRSAVMNMVLAETGAASAVAKAYPALKDKLTGSAIRVPTPDVSIAVLNLRLDERVDKVKLNRYLRAVSLQSRYQRQVDYVESPEIVSSDILGAPKAGVVDGLATIAPGTDSVVVYVWYDNEYGYSRQVVRVLESMTGSSLLSLPRG